MAHTKNDSLRVECLNDLSTEYLAMADVEKAEYYINKAYTQAKKLGNKTVLAHTYTNLGHLYTYNWDSDKGLQMYFQALKLHRTLGNRESVTDCYINIGATYDDKGDFVKAIKYYQYALNDAKERNDDMTMGNAYQNIGISAHQLGNYSESLKNLYQALRYYEKLKYQLGIADAANCLGNAYADMGNNEMGLKMYFRSLNICRKTKDKQGTANALVNIGWVYADQEKLNMAKEKYLEANVLFTELQEAEGMSITSTVLGELNHKLGNYTEALEMFDKALNIAIESEDKASIVHAKVGIANVYIKQKHYNQARKILNEALKISLDSGLKLESRECYEALVKVEKGTGNFEDALEYQNLWLMYKDSISNEETRQKGEQLAMTYEFDKKTFAKEQKHKQAIRDLKSQQFFVTVVLAILLVSAIVIAVFARRAYISRKKYTEVLSHENEHKEVLLQEVHHRVNNSLQMISSLLSIQADSTESEEVRQYLQKSENRVQAMSVMHQLLHLGNSKLEVDMKDYFNEVVDFYSNMLESRPGIRLNVNVPSVMFHTKLAMPLALILNELLTNSLKYAFPKDEGVIDISLHESEGDGSWLFQVRDNGIGFNTTNSTKTTSIGLDLVQLMTRQINGNLNMNGENGFFASVLFYRSY